MTAEAATEGLPDIRPGHIMRSRNSKPQPNGPQAVAIQGHNGWRFGLPNIFYTLAGTFEGQVVFFASEQLFAGNIKVGKDPSRLPCLGSPGDNE